jgi:hypothetical protein
VRKLDRQFVWRDRLLILTSDGLFVVEKSEDAVMTPQVKDHVPLDEIEKTACVALKDEIPEVAKTTSFRTEVARSEQKLDASEYEKQWLQMATDGMQAHVLSVKTYGEGVLAGRVLQFCLDTDDDVNLWVEQVSQAFLERMQILSGIQFTTHFIEFFVVETKRFVSSFVHVILTRRTCGQRSSKAAESKRRALGNYLFK